MFFAADRISVVRRMILATSLEARQKGNTQYDLFFIVIPIFYTIHSHIALDELLIFQRKDFEGILEVMDGLPVTVRLLDPPLHEFLPKVGISLFLSLCPLSIVLILL